MSNSVDIDQTPRSLTLELGLQFTQVCVSETFCVITV